MLWLVQRKWRECRVLCNWDCEAPGNIVLIIMTILTAVRAEFGHIVVVNEGKITSHSVHPQSWLIIFCLISICFQSVALYLVISLEIMWVNIWRISIVFTSVMNTQLSQCSVFTFRNTNLKQACTREVSLLWQAVCFYTPQWKIKWTFT